MTIDYQKLRLFGVYQQGQNDHLMLRVKIPAGFFTSAQAEVLCSLSERFSNGVLHLTSRGSIELHWLSHEALEEIFTLLAKAGLTTRGACGGAVRGISCSTTFASGFAAVQRVAQQFNRHFSGNPDFEGLPKKFKVGIDAGYQNARHLIQDLGLVMTETTDEGCIFDVWCAGGLGREPQAAILLERACPESQLIKLVEAVVQVYRDHTPPPKRLKFLLNTIGEDEFRRLLQIERQSRAQASTPEADPGPLLQAPAGTFLEVPIFAGEITTEQLRKLAEAASEAAGGQLAVTADQNIALLTVSAQQTIAMHEALKQRDIKLGDPDILPRLRVCPGNHECRMGLAPTRDIARQVSAAIGSVGHNLSLAISGCRNSCSQPQLADFGIVTKKLLTQNDGSRQPLFDLYRRDGRGLGHCIAAELSADALYALLGTLSQTITREEC